MTGAFGRGILWDMDRKRVRSPEYDLSGEGSAVDWGSGRPVEEIVEALDSFYPGLNEGDARPIAEAVLAIDDYPEVSEWNEISMVLYPLAAPVIARLINDQRYLSCVRDKGVVDECKLAARQGKSRTIHLISAARLELCRGVGQDV